MGLPTAPCGDDFDELLDDRIGYYEDIESDSETASFVPDVSFSRRSIQERGFGDWVSGVWTKVRL